jgi:hypothetical protein
MAHWWNTPNREPGRLADKIWICPLDALADQLGDSFFVNAVCS